jgi:hypothetical protein
VPPLFPNPFTVPQTNLKRDNIRGWTLTSLCDPAQSRFQGFIPSCLGRQRLSVLLLFTTLLPSEITTAPLLGTRLLLPLHSGLAYRRAGKRSLIVRGLATHSARATINHHISTLQTYTLTSRKNTISLFSPHPLTPRAR